MIIPFCTNEKIKAQRRQETCPRSHSSFVGEPKPQTGWFQESCPLPNFIRLSASGCSCFQPLSPGPGVPSAQTSAWYIVDAQCECAKKRNVQSLPQEAHQQREHPNQQTMKFLFDCSLERKPPRECGQRDHCLVLLLPKPEACPDTALELLPEPLACRSGTFLSLCLYLFLPSVGTWPPSQKDLWAPEGKKCSEGQEGETESLEAITQGYSQDVPSQPVHVRQGHGTACLSTEPRTQLSSLRTADVRPCPTQPQISFGDPCYVHQLPTNGSQPLCRSIPVPSLTKPPFSH